MPAHEATTLKIIGQREDAPVVFDPLGDEAGQLVRTCDKLSAADKIAWAYLRTRSESGRQQITITPAEVGHHEGRTADAGRARLNNLKDLGLIHVLFTCPKTKRVTIAVLDPLTVLTSRVAFVPADPQRVLPFGDSEPAPALLVSGTPADQALSESSSKASTGDAPSWSAQTRAPQPVIVPAAVPTVLSLAEDPPEEPPEDPRCASGPSGLSGPSSAAQIYRPLIIGRPSGLSVKGYPPAALAAEEPRRGTSGGTSDLEQLVAQRRTEQGIRSGDAQAELTAIRTAAAIGAASAFAVPSPAEQARRRESWIEVITRRVRDPNLRASVKVKVAAAIVEGELKPREVEELFAELDKSRVELAAKGVPWGVYFLRGAQALFRRHSLEWTGYASGGRRNPKPR